MDSFSRHEVVVGRCHPSTNLSLEKLPSVPNEKKAEWTREAVRKILAEKSLSCGEWNQISRSSSSCAHCATSVAVQ
jgi:hypothetical protein